MTTIVIEHVVTGKREDVTEQQWAQVNKLFPRMFRKIQSPKREDFSEEAKKIIADAENEE